MTPSDAQFRCIKSAADWFNISSKHKQVMTLGGYAGTGKSTILPFILEACKLDTFNVQFCAPTGKAAKVMTKKLEAQGFNTQAKTIHSTIYTPKAMSRDLVENKITLLTEAMHRSDDGYVIMDDGKSGTLAEANDRLKILEIELRRILEEDEDLHFSLNPNSPVMEKDLIVVDEGSMVGREVAEDLLQFNVPILVMGDPGQLPPVKDEAGFELENPDVFLTEIHRQAKDNPIIQLSIMARNGELLKPGVYGDGRAKVIRRRDDDVTYNPEIEKQVIVGTHKTRWAVTSKIRKERGLDEDFPLEGDYIVCCRNSKKDTGLINGTMATVIEGPASLQEGRASFMLNYKTEENETKWSQVHQALFEEHVARKKGFYSCSPRAQTLSHRKDEKFDFAWSITCHKSQGSQWDNVIVHDESGAFREDAPKWLYTAVTRAAENLTVVV